jgi:hypothetical protein
MTTALISYCRPADISRRQGERSRLYRTRAVHSEWDAQAQDLVTAYLQWKHYKYNKSSNHMHSEQVATRTFQVTAVDLNGMQTFIQC